MPTSDISLTSLKTIEDNALKIGAKDKTEEIVIRGLKTGKSVEELSELTNLSKTEVEAIKKKLDKQG